MNKNRFQILKWFEQNRQFKGSYRELSKELNIATSTLHRIMTDLIDEDYISLYVIDTTTLFVLNGTPLRQVMTIDFSEFNKQYGTQEITLNNRQLKLIEYLKKDCSGNYILKIKILYDLRDLYFKEDELIQYKNEAKKLEIDLETYFLKHLKLKQYYITQNRTLRVDVAFINEHIDISNMFIITKGGKNGGIRKASSFDMQMEIIKKQKEATLLLWRNNLKEAFALTMMEDNLNEIN